MRTPNFDSLDVPREEVPVTSTVPAKRRRPVLALLLVALCTGALVLALRGRVDVLLFRASLLTTLCMLLWLLEVIPLYATTLLLWASTVIILAPLRPSEFSLGRVLASAADPVMALFFGGFVLSVAGTKYRIDTSVARWIAGAASGRKRVLLFTTMAGTAVLSMWMSNIAAGAMMIASLRPLFEAERDDPRFRTALLLGTAFAADFGGIATPIGTGPNMIALGAVEGRQQISFLQWMSFGVPTAAVMLLATYVLLLVRYGVSGRIATREGPPARIVPGAWRVVVLFFLCVGAWLLEPIHGIPAGVIALAAAAALFAVRVLDATDLAALEWDTLLLVAGGLTLGHIIDASGLARAAASTVPWNELSPLTMRLLLVASCAGLSAVASNTAASALLVQVGLSLSPSPSLALLIALGASMGVPFVFSTPPNAMVYGEGGVHTRDFLVPGLVLLPFGCTLVAVFGPGVLRWCGIE